MSNATRFFTATIAMTLAFCPGARAIEPVLGGSRDARDVQTWLAHEPRGAGIEIGGLLWQPVTPSGLRYDDNIFASDAREHDDGIFSITPSLIGAATIGANEFALSAYVRSDFGFDWGNQDNTEFGAGARMKLKVLEWIDLTARYRYDRLAEDWDSPDVPLAAAERPELEQNSVAIGLQPHFGLFSSKFEFLSADVSYDDEVDALGGGQLLQIHRNRDIVVMLGELGYQVTDSIQGYVQFAWNDHGYDDWPIDRDGGGKKIFAGVRFHVADYLTGNVHAGYIFQNFGDDDARLEEASGFGFGAELEWAASPLRLRLDALREIEEATTDFESGRFTTTVLLRVDYRLADRLGIEGQFGYEKNDYVGTPRDEDRFIAGLAAIRDFGPNLYSRLAYRYGTRDSNAAGRSYDRNEILFTVGWKH